MTRSGISRYDMRNVGRALVVYGLVGVLAGVAGVGFTELISFAVELGGIVPEGPATGLRLPGSGDWIVVVIPLAGGLAVGLLCSWLAPEAMGSGAGRVIEAYHSKQGVIRHRVPLLKALASSITIGSGGSAGVEGPISHITAGIGAVMADWLRLERQERRTIIVAGMAAGIGAVFHAPMAAAILSAEILYSQMDLEHEVIVPSIIAATIAYSVFGAIAGWEPTFNHQQLVFGDELEMLPYTLLVVVLVAGALVFMSTVKAARTAIGENENLPRWVRPALGGLGVGLIGLFVPHALGTGLGIVQTALDGAAAIPMLLVLAATKTITSALTTGSGGSAGLFFPTVVVGGCLGGAVGIAAAELAPGLGVNPAAFVVVGMAGFLAAVMRAPLSAVIMVSELMGDYQLLVPALWVCVLTWLLSSRFQLYPEQLQTRFDAPAQLADMMGAVLERISVREAMDPRRPAAAIVRPDMPLAALVGTFATSTQGTFPILEPQTGELLGVVDGRELRRVLGAEGVSTLLIARDFLAPALTITPTDSLLEAMSRMTRSGHDDLIVVARDSPAVMVGLLSRRELIAAYHRKMLATTGGLAPRAVDPSPQASASQPYDLVEALLRGGIVSPAPGETREEIIRGIFEGPVLPPGVDRARLVQALLDREGEASTGVGDGLAIPHPHSRELQGLDKPTIILALADRPVDWDAIDGRPVDTIAVLLVPHPFSHMEVLSRLARCLADHELRSMLRERAPADRIVSRLEMVQANA